MIPSKILTSLWLSLWVRMKKIRKLSRRRKRKSKEPNFKSMLISTDVLSSSWSKC